MSQTDKVFQNGKNLKIYKKGAKIPENGRPIFPLLPTPPCAILSYFACPPSPLKSNIIYVRTLWVKKNVLTLTSAITAPSLMSRYMNIDIRDKKAGLCRGRGMKTAPSIRAMRLNVATPAT